MIAREPRMIAGMIASERNYLSVDLETSIDNPAKAKIYVLAVMDSYGDRGVLHTPRGRLPSVVLRALRKAFRRNVQIITHNGVTFDLRILSRVVGTMPTNSFDTLIGEATIATEDRVYVRKNLDSVMNRRLGISSKGKADHTQWDNPSLTEEQLDYVLGDVTLLPSLRDAQITAADADGLGYALSREQRLGIASAKMMRNGLAVSVSVLREYIRKLISDAKAAHLRVLSTFGTGFNVNSWQQIKAGMKEEYGLTLPNTQEPTMRRYAVNYPILNDILTAKKAMKQDSMYSEEWIDNNVHNGRIYPNLWQLGTDTTRYSSSDPNCQQIPKKMRKIFGHVPGRKVVQADYSSLELAMMAHLAKDEALIAAIQSDEDTYEFVVRQAIPSLQTAEVIEYKDRQLGKTNALSWIYLGREKAVLRSAAKYGAILDRAEVTKVLTTLDRLFPAVARQHQIAKNTKYARHTDSHLTITLPWGHKRRIAWNRVSPSQMLNTPTQGAGAIGIKEAIIEADDRGLMDYTDLQVHDELLGTSVPEADAEEYGRELSDSMIVGMNKVMTSLPPTVEVEIGDYWK